MNIKTVTTFGMRRQSVNKLISWLLFACAFGMVEAMCVVYLRKILGITGDYRDFAASKGLRLTTHTISDLLDQHGLLNMERIRELATILLLVAGSWSAGKSVKERYGLFAISFAAWDLSYYLFLKILTGFPTDLMDTDIYFLIPVDWYGPVWFPILVAMPAIMAAGLSLMRKRPKVMRNPAPFFKGLA